MVIIFTIMKMIITIMLTQLVFAGSIVLMFGQIIMMTTTLIFIGILTILIIGEQAYT